MNRSLALVITFATIAVIGIFLFQYTSLFSAKQPPPKKINSFALSPVVEGVEGSPVGVVFAQDAMYVVLQEGRVIKVSKDQQEVFLDITDKVKSGGEQGLLSMALHPQWPSEKKLYLNYTDRTGDTHIAQMQAKNDDEFINTQPQDLIVIDQPYPNHNGGLVLFGPDEQLYVGMGDGGAAADPGNNSQDDQSLLGKMLRFDLTAAQGDPEILYKGLRNPWRFSFDAETGDLYLADVGQFKWEEINYVPAEKIEEELNFGWDVYEGKHRFEPKSFTGEHYQPIYEYDHTQGCSVTGGYVYRGEKIPELEGKYLFADYCSDWIRVLDQEDEKTAVRQANAVAGITSFGEDENGELYITAGNSVYQLVPKE